MQISNRYILVEKVEEQAQEGFETVNPQDNFIYKGRVIALPEAPVYMGNKPVAMGDVVLFAKYSPDTHEIEGNKFVSVNDVLAVL